MKYSMREKVFTSSVSSFQPLAAFTSHPLPFLPRRDCFSPLEQITHLVLRNSSPASAKKLFYFFSSFDFFRIVFEQLFEPMFDFLLFFSFHFLPF